MSTNTAFSFDTTPNVSPPISKIHKLPPDLDADQLLHHLHSIITNTLSAPKITAPQNTHYLNQSANYLHHALQLSPKALAILTLLFKQWVLFQDDDIIDVNSMPHITTQTPTKAPPKLTPQQQHQQLLTKVMKHLPIIENVIVNYTPSIPLFDSLSHVSNTPVHSTSTSLSAHTPASTAAIINTTASFSSKDIITNQPIYMSFPYSLQPFSSLTSLSIEAPIDPIQTLIYLSFFMPNLNTSHFQLFKQHYKPTPPIPVSPIQHFDLLLPRLQSISLKSIRIPKYNDTLWFILLQHFTPYTDNQLLQFISPSILFSDDESDTEQSRYDKDDQYAFDDDTNSLSNFTTQSKESKETVSFSTPQKKAPTAPTTPIVTKHAMVMTTNTPRLNTTPLDTPGRLSTKSTKTTGSSQNTPYSRRSRSRSPYQSDTTQTSNMEETITLNGNLLWQLVLEYSTGYYKLFWTHLMKSRQLLTSLKLDTTQSISTSLPTQTNVSHNFLISPTASIHSSYAQRAYSPIVLTQINPFASTTNLPFHPPDSFTNNSHQSNHHSLSLPCLTQNPYYLARSLPSTLADCITQVHHTHFSWRELQRLHLSNTKCLRIGPSLFLTPRLNNLTLSQTSLHDPRGLCTLSDLNTLNLSFNPSSIYISPLHHCLSHNHINNIDFQPSFSFGKIDLISTLIHETTNLQHLNLAGNALNDVHLPALSFLRFLPIRTLDLSYNFFESFSQLWPLRSLTWLRHISLHNTPLADKKNYRTNVAIIFVDNWAVPDAFTLYSTHYYTEQSRLRYTNLQSNKIDEKSNPKAQNVQSIPPQNSPYVPLPIPLANNQFNLLSPFPACPHYIIAEDTQHIAELYHSTYESHIRSPEKSISFQSQSSSIIAHPFYIDGVPLSEQEATAALRAAKMLHEQLRNMPLFCLSVAPTLHPQQQVQRKGGINYSNDKIGNTNRSNQQQHQQQLQQQQLQLQDSALFDPSFIQSDSPSTLLPGQGNIANTNFINQIQANANSQQINVATVLMHSILPPHLSWKLIQHAIKQEKSYFQSLSMQNSSNSSKLHSISASTFFDNSTDHMAMLNSLHTSVSGQNVTNVATRHADTTTQSTSTLSSVLLQLYPPVISTHPIGSKNSSQNYDVNGNTNLPLTTTTVQTTTTIHPPLTFYHRFSHLFLSKTVASTTNGCLLSVLASPCLISATQTAIIQSAFYINDTIDYSSSNPLLDQTKFISLQDTINTMISTTTPAKTRKKKTKNIYDDDNMSFTTSMMSYNSTTSTVKTFSTVKNDNNTPLSKTLLKLSKESQGVPHELSSNSVTSSKQIITLHQRADDFLYDDNDIVIQADGQTNAQVSHKLREFLSQTAATQTDANSSTTINGANPASIGDLAQALDQDIAADNDFLLLSSTIHKNKKGKKKKVAPDGQWSEKKLLKKGKINSIGDINDSMTIGDQHGENGLNSNDRALNTRFHGSSSVLDVLSPSNYQSNLDFSYNLDENENIYKKNAPNANNPTIPFDRLDRFDRSVGLDGEIDLDDLDESDLRLRTSLNIDPTDDLLQFRNHIHNDDTQSSLHHNDVLLYGHDEDLRTIHHHNQDKNHIMTDSSVQAHAHANESKLIQLEQNVLTDWELDKNDPQFDHNSRRISQTPSQISTSYQKSTQDDPQDDPQDSSLNPHLHAHPLLQHPLLTPHSSMKLPFSPTSDPHTYKHVMFRSFLRYFDMDIGLLTGTIFETMSKRPKKTHLLSSIFASIYKLTKNPNNCIRDESLNQTKKIIKKNKWSNMISSMNSSRPDSSDKRTKLLNYSMFTTHTRFLTSLSGLNQKMISQLYPNEPYNRYRFLQSMIKYKNMQNNCNNDDMSKQNNTYFAKKNEKSQMNIFVEQNDPESLFLTQLIANSVDQSTRILQTLQPLIWPTLMNNQRIINTSQSADIYSKSNTSNTPFCRLNDLDHFDDDLIDLTSHPILSSNTSSKKIPNNFIDRLIDINIIPKIQTLYTNQLLHTDSTLHSQSPISSLISHAMPMPSTPLLSSPSSIISSSSSSSCVLSLPPIVDISQILFDEMMEAQSSMVQDDLETQSLISTIDAESTIVQLTTLLPSSSQSAMISQPASHPSNSSIADRASQNVIGNFATPLQASISSVESTPIDDDLCTPIPLLLSEVIEKHENFNQISQLDLTLYISTPDYFTTPQLPLHHDFFTSLSTLYLFSMLSPNFIDFVSLFFTPSTFPPLATFSTSSISTTTSSLSSADLQTTHFTTMQPTQSTHPHLPVIANTLCNALPLLFQSYAAQRYRNAHYETLLSTLNYLISSNFKTMSTNDGGFLNPSQFTSSSSFFSPQIIKICTTVPEEIFDPVIKSFQSNNPTLTHLPTQSQTQQPHLSSQLELFTNTLQPFFYHSYFSHAPSGLYSQRQLRHILSSFITLFLTSISSISSSLQTTFNVSNISSTLSTINTCGDDYDDDEIKSKLTSIQQSLTTNINAIDILNFNSYLNMNKVSTAISNTRNDSTSLNAFGSSNSFLPLNTVPTFATFVQVLNRYSRQHTQSSPPSQTSSPAMTNLNSSIPPTSSQHSFLQMTPHLLFLAFLLFSVSTSQLQLPTTFTPHQLNLMYEQLKATNSITPSQLRYFQLLSPSLFNDGSQSTSSNIVTTADTNGSNNVPHNPSFDAVHAVKIHFPFESTESNDLESYRDYIKHLENNNCRIAPFFAQVNNLNKNENNFYNIPSSTQNSFNFITNTHNTTSHIETDEFSTIRLTCPLSSSPSSITSTPIVSPQSSIPYLTAPSSTSTNYASQPIYNKNQPPHLFKDSELVFAFTIRIAVDPLSTSTDRLKHQLNRHYETSAPAQEYSFTTIENSAAVLPPRESVPSTPRNLQTTHIPSTPSANNSTSSFSFKSPRMVTSTPSSSTILSKQAPSTPKAHLHKSPLISRFPSLPSPPASLTSPPNPTLLHTSRQKSERNLSRQIEINNSQPSLGLTSDATTRYFNQRESFTTPYQTTSPSPMLVSQNNLTTDLSPLCSSLDTTNTVLYNPYLPQSPTPLLSIPLHPSFLTFSQTLFPYSTFRASEPLLLPVNFTAQPMPTMQLLKRQKNLARLSSSPLNPNPTSSVSVQNQLQVLPKLPISTYLTKNYLEIYYSYQQLYYTWSCLNSQLIDTSIQLQSLVEYLTEEYTLNVDNNLNSIGNQNSTTNNSISNNNNQTSTQVRYAPSSPPTPLALAICTNPHYVALQSTLTQFTNELQQMSLKYTLFYMQYIPQRIISSPFLSAFMQPPLSTFPLLQSTHHHRRISSASASNNVSFNSPNSQNVVTHSTTASSTSSSFPIQIKPPQFTSIDLIWSPLTLGTSGLITATPKHINLYFRHAFMPTQLSVPSQSFHSSSSSHLSFDSTNNSSSNTTHHVVSREEFFQQHQQYKAEQILPLHNLEQLEPIAQHSWNELVSIHVGLHSLDLTLVFASKSGMHAASNDHGHPIFSAPTTSRLTPSLQSNSNTAKALGDNSYTFGTSFPTTGTIQIKPATINMYKIITNSKQSTLILIDTISKYSQLFRTITEIRQVHTRLSISSVSISSPTTQTTPTSINLPTEQSVQILQKVPLDIVLDTESSANLLDDIVNSVITYTNHHTTVLQHELNPHKISTTSNPPATHTTPHDKFSKDPLQSLATNIAFGGRRSSTFGNLTNSSSQQTFTQFPWQPNTTRLSHVSRVLVSMAFATIDFNSMNGSTRVFEPLYPFHFTPTASTSAMTSANSSINTHQSGKNNICHDDIASVEYNDFLIHCHKKITAQREQTQTIGSNKVTFPNPSTPSFSLNTSPTYQSPSVVNQTTPLSHSVLFCASVNGHIFIIEDSLTSVVGYNNVPFSYQQKALEYTTSLYSHDYTILPDFSSDTNPHSNTTSKPHSTVAFVIPPTLFSTAHHEIHALSSDITQQTQNLINSTIHSSASRIPTHLLEYISTTPSISSNSTSTAKANTLHSGDSNTITKRYRVIACEPISSLLSIITHPVTLPISPLDSTFLLENKHTSTTSLSPSVTAPNQTSTTSSNYNYDRHSGPNLINLAHLQQSVTKPAKALQNQQTPFSSVAASDFSNIALTFGAKEVFNSVIYTARVWSIFAPNEVLAHLLKHINQQRAAR